MPRKAVLSAIPRCEHARVVREAGRPSQSARRLGRANHAESAGFLLRDLRIDPVFADELAVVAEDTLLSGRACDSGSAHRAIDRGFAGLDFWLVDVKQNLRC
jgi:hypothetical protein